MEIRQPDDHDEFVGEDFDDAVEFTGKCSYCLQVFLKTFVDPRFSIVLPPDNTVENAFRESIKTQRYMDLESIGGIKV